MSNELAAFSSIPFSPAALAKPRQNLDRGYAPRLQLISTGTSGIAMKKQAQVGNFAIVDGDRVEDVGDSHVIIPLARLDKAVDTSGDSAVVAFGQDNPEFQSIAARCDRDGFDSGCMYGPVFLVFHVGTCQFLEIYLNNKSGRLEAERINTYLPISKEAAEQYGVDARAPAPVSLSSKLIPAKGKRRNSWYVPVAEDGPATLNVETPPSPEELQKACGNFIKQAQVEKEDRDR